MYDMGLDPPFIEEMRAKNAAESGEAVPEKAVSEEAVPKKAATKRPKKKVEKK